MGKTLEDIGIYTNIHESGRKNKDGNKMYYATCKVCGVIVEKKLANIKRSNKVCHHKAQKNNLNKINDMPVGWVNQSKLNRKIYDVWRSMLYRATEKCWEKNPTYIGTTVDDSWRILSNFINDIKELPGYEEWINSEKRMMMLDKDTLINGNKHYSKETCCFITALESSKDVNERHPNNTLKASKESAKKYSIPVKIINKQTCEEKIFTSLREACRSMGWNEGNAWRVISDKYPHDYSIKGWKIERLNMTYDAIVTSSEYSLIAY